MAMIQEFVRLQADVSVARQEFVLGMAAKPMLKRAQLPDGEGRPVLLLPGFGANEALLKRLNNFLRHNGYESEMFIPGFPNNETLQEFIDSLVLTLSAKVDELKQRTGKDVSLVGQSAGGIYSREFARLHFENLDRVITLGSPTFYPENLHLQNKALAALIERKFGTSSERAFANDRFVHWEKDSPPIPYVAIYSKIDGAVRAETAAIPESQLNVTKNGAVRENIAVTASHFGMVLNPLVMLAIADRLGADPGNWKAFDPKDHLPQNLHRLSPLAYPKADMSERRIPSMDLHPHQPRGRDARERVTHTLKTEHGNIEKLLYTLLEEIDSSDADHQPNYTLAAGILDYLNSYTDGFHHPREDLLFERLVKREPKLTKIINALMEEHQVIDTLGTELEEVLLKHLSGKRSKQRNKRLDTLCLGYVKRLQAHLAQEEKKVFSRTTKLQRQDWTAVDRGLAYQPDPLFGQIVQQRYEELADNLAGRAEGISASVALSNVIGLEAIASCLDVLGSGFAKLGKQNSSVINASVAKQLTVLKQSMNKPSLLQAFKLPFALARANAGLAKENAMANIGITRDIANDIKTAVNQARSGV
jgi:hemerythrin-like domain-containing protein/pimeloyl-ACP methyl ester carboxylesterase